MVNSVLTPAKVGSVAKVLRRYAGTSPVCQSWQCRISGRKSIARDAERRPREDREADVIIGIVDARFAVEAFAIEERRAIDKVDRELSGSLIDRRVVTAGPRWTGRWS